MMNISFIATYINDFLNAFRKARTATVLAREGKYSEVRKLMLG